MLKHSSDPQIAPGRLRWLRFLFALAVLGLCALFLGRIEPARVLEALGSAHLHLVLAAALVNVLANLPARVMRWRALLSPLPHRGREPGFWELARLFLASLAANNLIPAHPGEALRVVQLNRRYGYTSGAVVASLLLEKLLCWWTVAVGAVLVLLFSPLPQVVEVPMAVFAGGIISLVVLLIVLARRQGNGDPVAGVDPPREAAQGWGARLRVVVRAFLLRLAEAMRLMHAPRVWLSAVLFSFLSSMADIAMVGLCLSAVGVQLGFESWALFYLIVNMVIAVPSTPGQVGVLETGGVLALTLLGVDSSRGLSATLIYHAAHLLPMTALGLVTFRWFLKAPQNKAPGDS